MSSPSSSALIRLSKQELEKCAEFMWEKEAVACAQEVRKIHSNGGSAPRTIVITAGAFYVFKTKGVSKKIGCSNTYAIVSLKEMSYVASKSRVYVTFEIDGTDGSFVFECDNALQIGEILLGQLNIINYNLPNPREVKVNAIEMPKPYKLRPPYLLQTRLSVLAHKYNTYLDMKTIRQYKTFQIWDKNPSGPLRLDSRFDPGDAIQAVAHAISWDSDIHQLVLDGFSPAHLGKFVSTLFSESTSLARISFENYQEASSQPFTLKSREGAVMPSLDLSFRYVSSDLIMSMFHALRDFGGRIKSLALIGCMFRSDDLGEIFRMIQSLRCFVPLTKLKLDQVSADRFPDEEFVMMLEKRSLSNISVCSMDLEGTEILQKIVESVKTPRHIEVTGMHFTLPIQFATFPESITLLDVSNCDFGVDTFVSLLERIVGTPRSNTKQPMFFYASGIKGATTKQLLSPLLKPKDGKVIKIHPNILELNWSNNPLTPRDMKTLIKFLQHQTNLKYLDIGNCLLPRNNPTQSLQMLSAFLQERPLEGLDLQSDPEDPISSDLANFLSNISRIRGLKSLRIIDSQLKDSGIDVLLKFIAECQDITELDIDGFGVSSAAELIRLYSGVVANARISALNNPKRDLKALGIEETSLPVEVRKMMQSLKSKRFPRTAAQRLEPVDRFQVDGMGEDARASKGRVDGLDSGPITEEMSLERLLHLEEGPVGAAQTRTKTDPLAEFNNIMRAMIATMRGQPSERRVDPVQTARIVMDHLVSSKKALKINNIAHAQPGTRLNRRSSARRLTFV